MINRMFSTEKKRNRGHLTSDTGDPSQPGGSSKERLADILIDFEIVDGSRFPHVEKLRFS